MISFLVRLARHRQIAEPELIVESSEDSDEGTWHPEREESSEEEEEEEEEVDDEVSSLEIIPRVRSRQHVVFCPVQICCLILINNTSIKYGPVLHQDGDLF